MQRMRVENKARERNGVGCSCIELAENWCELLSWIRNAEWRSLTYEASADHRGYIRHVTQQLYGCRLTVACRDCRTCLQLCTENTNTKYTYRLQKTFRPIYNE